MTNHRRARLNGLLREELTLILGGELGDPRLAPVIVNDVDISADYRNLRVYFSVLDDDRIVEREAMRGLEHASAYLRRRLAEHVNLRFTPELSFKLDRTEARAERINRLLDQIAAQPGAAPAVSQEDAH